MTTCIKCGRNIPDGELFCPQCSKSPVIAELGVTHRPAAPKKVPTPRSAPVAMQKKKAAKRPWITWVLAAALALVTGLFLWQQIGLQAEKNRARLLQDEAQSQIHDLAEAQEGLAAAEAELEKLEQTLKIKEAEIRDLTEQLADSRSSQNQGAYDLSNTEKELEALQEEYNTLKEEHDLMVEAVEAAAKYKDKALFLDKYVVFVMNDGSNRYHTYDCELFTHSNFWTYSPKLAEAQGFRPCTTCIE